MKWLGFVLVLIALDVGVGSLVIPRLHNSHRTLHPYYHHGMLELSLNELARNGAWIHASEQIFREAEDQTLILDKVKSAVSAGLRFVLHVEKGLEVSLLHDVMNSSAFILFAASLFENKSPLRMLAKKARKRKLNSRAYYLYPNIMP